MVKIPNLPGVKILRALKLSYCNGVRITDVRVCLFKSSFYLHVWNLFDGFCLLFLNCIFFEIRGPCNSGFLQNVAWHGNENVSLFLCCLHEFTSSSIRISPFTWNRIIWDTHERQLSIFRSSQTRVLSSFPLIRSLQTSCYLVILWCAKGI